MRNKTPTNAIKNIKNAVKDIFRALSLIAFGMGALVGITCGMYAYVAHTESERSLVTYDADHWPDSFPLLITRAHDDGQPAVHLKFCYLSEDGAVDERLYQVPGKGQVQIDRYDSGHYTVEAVTDTRTRATLNFCVGGGDRKVRYVYFIEDNRVHPQSYQLMAYFGWMFNALPLSFLATCIFIFISKQAYNLTSKRMALRKLKYTP
jgi:hypothetical protein